VFSLITQPFSDTPSTRGIERMPRDRVQRYKDLARGTIKQFIETQTVEDKKTKVLTLGGCGTFDIILQIVSPHKRVVGRTLLCLVPMRIRC